MIFSCPYFPLSATADIYGWINTFSPATSVCVLLSPAAAHLFLLSSHLRVMQKAPEWLCCEQPEQELGRAGLWESVKMDYIFGITSLTGVSWELQNNLQNISRYETLIFQFSPPLYFGWNLSKTPTQEMIERETPSARHSQVGIAESQGLNIALPHPRGLLGVPTPATNRSS